VNNKRTYAASRLEGDASLTTNILARDSTRLRLDRVLATA